GSNLRPQGGGNSRLRSSPGQAHQAPRRSHTSPAATHGGNPRLATSVHPGCRYSARGHSGGIRSEFFSTAAGAGRSGVLPAYIRGWFAGDFLSVAGSVAEAPGVFRSVAQ